MWLIAHDISDYEDELLIRQFRQFRGKTLLIEAGRSFQTKYLLFAAAAAAAAVEEQQEQRQSVSADAHYLGETGSKEQSKCLPSAQLGM